MSLFEISSEKQFVDDRSVPQRLFAFNYWVKTNVSKAHRYFLSTFILGDGIEKPNWSAHIKEVNKEISRLSQKPKSKQGAFTNQEMQQKNRSRPCN